MAEYRNRASSGAGRRPARTSGRAPARGPARGGRGGGGNNNTAITVVAIVILGGVVAFFAVAGGKKDKPTPAAPHVELTGSSNVSKERRAEPAKPTRTPPPPLSAEVQAQAKSLVASIDAERKQGDELYEAAMRAKEKGDTDLWQKHLKQAAQFFNTIKDRWNNEIIDAIMLEMPQTTDWDAEEVANHYLGKEGQQIAKALERLAYIKKQIRLDD